MTWSAKVTINGTDYIYPDGPTLPGFKVYFRDREIAFHWGAARDESIAPAHLDPYETTIYQNGTEIAHYAVPQFPLRDKHWWRARWLHYLAPDAVVRTPADLIAQRLSPPYGDTGIPIPDPGVITFAGPMDNAGLRVYEPTTGEDNWIGLVNEYAGQYMLTGNASSVIQAGMASFSMPMFVTDENTGKPWDLIKEPSANTYAQPNQGTPWLGAVAPNPNVTEDDKFMPWALDGAHADEDEAMVYFITGEDRHLEALQYRTMLMFLEDAYTTGTAGFAVCAPAQTRKTAWSLAMLGRAVKATQMREAQGALPDYLLPSSTLKQMLDNQRTWITKRYMNNPDYQTFRVWPDTRAAMWQADYLNSALALLVMYFPDEWGPIYLWTLGNLIARTNGKTGWPPAYPSVYYVNLFSDSTVGNQGTTPYSDWGAVWNAFKAGQLAGTDVQGNNGLLTSAEIDALDKDQYNGGWWVVPQQNSSYCMEARSALAFAVWLDRNKIIDVSGTYPELEQCYAAQEAMSQNAKFMAYRWSIAVDPQPVTVTTVTPTSPSQPSGGSGNEAPPAQTLPTPEQAADISIFDKAAVLNLQTDQDAVLVDLTGKIPSGTGQLLFNLKGNGQTRVTVIWPGPQANWVIAQPDTSKGGKPWSEQHATGNSFVLYDCGTSLIFDGTQIGVPQADPPPSDPPPTQTEPLMSDPLQPIKDEVAAIETSVTNLLSRLTTLAANASAAGTQVDPAEITALVAEMQQNIQAKIDGAAPLPAA